MGPSGGSWIKAMLLFSVNLASIRVDRDAMDLCVFSWKILVSSFRFFSIRLFVNFGPSSHQGHPRPIRWASPGPSSPCRPQLR